MRSASVTPPPALARSPLAGDANTAIFGLNAFGFLSSVCSIACCRSCALSNEFLHAKQLQSSQYRPLAKHSQYSFKHFEFLQLHFFPAGFAGDALVSAIASDVMPDIPPRVVASRHRTSHQRRRRPRTASRTALELSTDFKRAPCCRSRDVRCDRDRRRRRRRRPRATIDDARVTIECGDARASECGGDTAARRRRANSNIMCKP